MDRSEAVPFSRSQAADSPIGAALPAWRPDQTPLAQSGGALHTASDENRFAGSPDGADGVPLKPEHLPSSADGDEGGASSAANDLGEARQLSERLTWTLRTLEERERSAYRLDRETMERIRRLEHSAQRIAAVHRALEDRLKVETDEAELEVLGSLLKAWVDRPNDLLVMVKLAERSTALARIVDGFREIRRLLSAVGEDACAEE
jgi:hypothetical protein